MDSKVGSLFGIILMACATAIILYFRSVSLELNRVKPTIKRDMTGYNRTILYSCNGYDSITPTIVQNEVAEVNSKVETPVVASYVGEFDVAANCCEKYNHICGGTGITASGMPQVAGITVGANFDSLPAGTWIYIDGVGIRQVQDTGPDCPMNHIDVAVETHEEALKWELQGIHDVWILEDANES